MVSSFNAGPLGYTVNLNLGVLKVNNHLCQLVLYEMQTRVKISTFLKHDVCFTLAMFHNICLFYDNAVTFYTYDALDVSRVTV